MTSASRYRPDIDGLRAVAVSLILLFHVGCRSTPGGFVGVDIFFVISGFLITKNIAEQLDAGTFSFADFYTRRARRLFPALSFTLGACFISSLWLLSPADLERFGGSLLCAVFFIANHFFWRESGYFDPAAESKPLLHAWSLSVEEQFYLIWPALLFGLSRIRKKRVMPVFLAAAGVISLCFCERLFKSHPAAAFFLLPARVFEFAIGAGCVWAVGLQREKKLFLEASSILGAAMIAWSAVEFTRATPFPGFAALIPCAGTALIIYAGDRSFCGILLRNRIMVGLGRISYSVYLIHWPLIVFYKYWKFAPIGGAERSALLMASILLGIPMWRFIETPFRAPAEKSAWDPIRIAAPMIALALSLVAAAAWLGEGFPSRFPAEFHMTAAEIFAERSRYWDEFDPSRKPAVLKGAEGSRNIIVLGNSHAVDLMYALRQNGLTADITFLDTTHKCLNYGTPLAETDRDFCLQTKKNNFSDGNWGRADAVYIHDDWPRNDLSDLRAVLPAIRRLTSAPIYVFGPKMTYSSRVPEIVHAHMRTASLNEFSKQYEVSGKVDLNNALKRLFEQDVTTGNNSFFVDVLDAQCGGGLDHCQIISEKNSRFLYFDSNHFTAQGAAEFGARLKAKRPELFR